MKSLQSKTILVLMVITLFCIVALTKGGRVWAAGNADLASICSGNNGNDVSIPQPWAYYSYGTWAVSPISLACPGADASPVTRVDVSLDLIHSWIGDLQIFVCNATGCHTLWNHAGGNTENISQSWQLHTFDGDSVNQTWQLYVRDGHPWDSGYIDSWSITAHYEGTEPRIVGATPAYGQSCAEEIQAFVTTVEDPEDPTALHTVEYLFDAGAWMVDAVRLKYDRVQDKLYLRDADNTAWLGGNQPGEDAVLENRFVRLHVDDSATSVDDKRLSITWAIAFKPDFVQVEPYKQRLYVTRRAGEVAGWKDVGAWRVLDCQPGTTITPMHTPTQTPTRIATPPAGTETAITFQHGVNDYTGSQDVGIVSWLPDENFDGGENDTMKVRTHDQLAGLIQFDVGSIPDEAQITEATLSLYAWERYSDRPITVGAYEVYRPWVAAEATWNQATATDYWALPGCNDTTHDRAATPVSETELDDVPQWYDWDVTELVRKWISEPSSNHGVVLKAFGLPSGVKLVTAEHGGIKMHPKLTIRFEMPEPAATPTDIATPTPSATTTEIATLTATPTSTGDVTQTPTRTSTTTPVTETPSATATEAGALRGTFIPLLLK